MDLHAYDSYLIRSSEAALISSKSQEIFEVIGSWSSAHCCHFCRRSCCGRCSRCGCCSCCSCCSWLPCRLLTEYAYNIWRVYWINFMNSALSGTLWDSLNTEWFACSSPQACKLLLRRLLFMLVLLRALRCGISVWLLGPQSITLSLVWIGSSKICRFGFKLTKPASACTASVSKFWRCRKSAWHLAFGSLAHSWAGTSPGPHKPHGRRLSRNRFFLWVFVTALAVDRLHLSPAAWRKCPRPGWSQRPAPLLGPEKMKQTKS